MTDHTIEIRYLKASEISTKSSREIAERLNIPIRESDGTMDEVLKRHILGCWLVQNFLESEGLIDFNYNNITRGVFGKPYISGTSFFNISHSNDLIIAAFSKNGEVGIDVEFVKPLPWPEYEDSFSAGEWQRVCSSPTPAVMVLELWTMKESILKADGRGLQVSLSSVKLLNGYGIIGEEEKKWFYKPLHFHGYVCCLASEYFADTIKNTKVSP